LLHHEIVGAVVHAAMLAALRDRRVAGPACMGPVIWWQPHDRTDGVTAFSRTPANI
jgi:hypothetical protein